MSFLYDFQDRKQVPIKWYQSTNIMGATNQDTDACKRIEAVEEKLGLIQDQLQAMNTQVQNQGTDLVYVKHKMDELSSTMNKLLKLSAHSKSTNSSSSSPSASPFSFASNPSSSPSLLGAPATSNPTFGAPSSAASTPSFGFSLSSSSSSTPSSAAQSAPPPSFGFVATAAATTGATLYGTSPSDPSSLGNRESVLTSLGSQIELLKLVDCCEKGQKVEMQSGISSNTLPALSETDDKHQNSTSLDNNNSTSDAVNNSTSDAVRVCFKRLVENLDSTDNAQTLAATVGVICELASKEPRSYLPPAPEFYRILVDSRNNWVLIKVLKIFAKLAKLEPRSAKKVIEPICDYMKRSKAKSLVFECVRAIVSSLHEYELAVKLADARTRDILWGKDQSLRYLGLQGLLLVVIGSLSDVDLNIKLEALRLVMLMVSEDNAVEIRRILIGYALKSDPEFCNEILRSMLSTCSRNVYETINNFNWYVSLLGETARIPHCQNGEEIEFQLVDIGTRVKNVRPEFVRVWRELLIDPALLGNPLTHRILSAAAFVSGEYVDFSRNPFEIMEALLQPRAVYIHSAFKVLTFCLHSFLLPDQSANSSVPNFVEIEPCVTHSASEKEFADTNSSKKDALTHELVVTVLTFVLTSLSPLTENHDVEVQERVRNLLGLAQLAPQEISCIHDQKQKMADLKTSFLIRLIHDSPSKDPGPISLNSQQRVLIPDLKLPVQPELLLRVKRKTGGNQDELEVIIGWHGLTTSKATWEDFTIVNLQFPEFHLEGKVEVWDAGNDKTRPMLV